MIRRNQQVCLGWGESLALFYAHQDFKVDFLKIAQYALYSLIKKSN